MLRIAVIGAGHWGPNLIRNFHDQVRSEVVWVFDHNGTRLEQVKFRFPGVKVDTDSALALKDASVDAVVVATPTSTHYELARDALEAGKHVLVEKPMATNSLHAENLCDIAEQNNLVLLVGHVFVYNTAIRQVKEYFDRGHLGRIYYISSARTNLGPIRVDVNAAWDLASHDVSIVNYWLGTEPLTASAVGGTWINSGIEDALFATLRYPGEVLVNLHASWLNPRKAREITVVGDKRMLTFDDMNLGEPLRIYDKRVTEQLTTPTFIDTFASFRASIREGDITIPKISTGEPLQTECDHFLDCIMESRQPLSGGPEGLAVVRAIEAIQRSIQNEGLEEKV